MVARKRIGLVYSYDSGWIGGTYYVENIIKAIHLLPDNYKPEVIIFYTDATSLENAKRLTIDYVDYVKIIPLSSNIIVRTINKLSRILFNTVLIVPKYQKTLPDYLFPYNYNFPMIKNKIYWIPDFQEHYLPEMFQPKDVSIRKRSQKELSITTHKIVFSSQSALNDYKKFYPANQNDCKLLNFSCIQSTFDHIDIDKLKEKFSIQKPYFFVPNQFWKHKNHRIVIEALNTIKKKTEDLNFCIVFTGKEDDFRNKDHFASLQKLVTEYKLQDSIRFLGFIDRLEQLQLMNNAIAVIQPSLFEGWSTVVEDAKSMSQFLILSNIDVHKEQVSVNGLFFDPHNQEDLANQMIRVVANDIERTKIDYDKNIEKFALNFINIFD